MTRQAPDSSLPSPAALGFVGGEAEGWLRRLRGREVRFRLLRTLTDLEQAERLQEEVFGVSERDLASAGALMSVAETGGAVLAAFLPDDPGHAAGVLVGWGGFVDRRPRIVSDFLAVRADARNLGLAAELKRLQAALALAQGFVEIVWTVDPLRAANARLNFGKLGATAAHYEIDRYGSGFATGLYGGMASDRLHVTWRITEPSVIARLRGEPAAVPEASNLPIYEPGVTRDRTMLPIPDDIDALLAADPAAALVWRLRLRDALPMAFAAGFAITGFRPAGDGTDPAYLLARQPPERRTP